MADIMTEIVPGVAVLAVVAYQGFIHHQLTDVLRRVDDLEDRLETLRRPRIQAD